MFVKTTVGVTTLRFRLKGNAVGAPEGNFSPGTSDER